MTGVWALAAMWFGLALIASLVSVWFRGSTALTEIIIGIVAQLIIGAIIGSGVLDTNDIWLKFLSGAGVLGTNDIWVKFLSGAGAILLTFLAGAELDPSIFKLKWKEATTVGFTSFIFPFLGSAAAAHYFLGWGVMPSWLAGIAMSTTSAAIVYAVTLEFGFNTTGYGKTILVACFVTDLMSVVALGLIFARFTIKTLISLGVAAAVLVVLPWLTPRLFKRYGGRLSEFETKFLLFCLLGLGALADWADSEAVLPAYLIGMVLAGTVGKDHALIRRLRTLTFGLMTPFYFILVGTFVSIPALIAAPAPFIFFLIVKIAAKFVGVLPVTKLFGSPNKEAMYTTLLMSTGLTFGTIASLFGRSHGIIDSSQYSTLVAAIIGTAIIPTIVANTFFLPSHLLPRPEPEMAPSRRSGVLGKVVHANDGSEHAFHALAQALAIAKQNNSELHMVSVEKIGYVAESTEQVTEGTGTASGRFCGVLQRARAMADESQVDLHTHVVAGHPVRSIVTLAAELDADLLVIGARGHSTLYERLVGSRAERIMKLASCPVLVVK
jgi:glutathione-regulated potassium-efflux system ancillary protein KefC